MTRSLLSYAKVFFGGVDGFHYMTVFLAHLVFFFSNEQSVFTISKKSLSDFQTSNQNIEMIIFVSYLSRKNYTYIVKILKFEIKEFAT